MTATFQKLSDQEIGDTWGAVTALKLDDFSEEIEEFAHAIEAAVAGPLIERIEIESQAREAAQTIADQARVALAQQPAEQEPVAWIKDISLACLKTGARLEATRISPQKDDDSGLTVPLYLAPPQPAEQARDAALALGYGIMRWHRKIN